MSHDMLLFFALLFFAVAIAGASAMLIFWPLTLVHIRDRHPQFTAVLGQGAFFKPKAWWWLLRGEYRRAGDRNLNGLATPARLSLMTILFGIAMGGLLWLIAGGA